MKTTNDGGPAFPCESYGHRNGKETTVPAQGMTLRDYFAGQTLAADYMGDYEYAERAKAAYKAADAMLAAREGKQ
jgi:hypothetical protein